jgi:hypothetical protein
MDPSELRCYVEKPAETQTSILLASHLVRAPISLSRREFELRILITLQQFILENNLLTIIQYIAYHLLIFIVYSNTLRILQRGRTRRFDNIEESYGVYC